MKLDDNGGFGSFGFDVAKETGELDENMNERKGYNKRPGRADDNYPSVTLSGNDSACFSLRAQIEVITRTMSFLATSTVSGSPKMEIKLPE